MYKKFIYQILFVMRLTIVVLILGMMQVSAISFAQKVNYVKKQATLEEIFEAIRVQTGYNVFYSSNKIDDSKKMDVRFKDTELKAVLDLCAEKQSLAYNIEAKNIFFKPKEKNIVDKIISLFSAIDIRGKVVDEQGQPLPGASVKVKDGTLGAVTDNEGEFFLKGVSENAVIIIAYLGYKPFELKAIANMGVIKLEQLSSELDEVAVNKGYYTEAQRLSTGSVGRVNSETISKQPVINPLQTLQGRVPGIYIQQNTGLTGGNFQVRIRGTNSIQNGNDPFYIVDGVPYISETLSEKSNFLFAGNSGMSPLNSINPTDIESIEILKDADATAIYGSRGANGVILITTKKGKIGDTKLDINLRNGVSKALPRMKLMNTQQYISMREEALANDGISKPNSLDYDINGTWDKSRYTDWQEELIGGTALTTLLNASLSGGNAQTQYSIGSGFNRETTVFIGDGAAKRFTAHLNLTHRSKNQKFSFSVNSTLGNNNSDFVYQDFTSTALTLAPNAPALYKKDGSLNWENSTFGNPLAALNGKFDGKTFTLINSLEFGYQVLKDVRVSTRVGMTELRNRELITRPHTIYGPEYGFTSAVSALNIGDASIKSWQLEPQLNYDKQFGEHKFSVLAGAAIQQSTSERSDEQYRNFPSNSLILNPASASEYQLTSYNYSLYKYAALFGRIGYDYKNKYLLNLTGRRDGSSRFGQGNQFATLGAFGLAWIFTGERFFENWEKVLSFGKVRTSYGITGNDQIGDYQYLDTYTGLGQYQGIPLLSPTQLYNPDFGWETNRKFEAALDLGFVGDKITTTLAYFQNRSSNQLVNYRLAGTTGFPSIIKNLPAIVQNNGCEVGMSTINIRHSSFSWITSFNITSLRNKLVDFPNIESSSYYRTYEVGKSLNVSKVFDFEGIDPNSGLAIFADMNGDGALTFEDKLYSIELKQGFFGGLNNSFSFKGFQADVFFQFVKQDRYRYNAVAPAGRNNVNQSIEVLENRWRHVGDYAERLKFSTRSMVAESYSNLIYSDWNLEDASFIRLKNVSFSYQLPVGWIKNINAKIYLQGQNLFTMTNYKGLDPETGSSSLPPLTTFIAGFQFTF